jgi:exopolysaccharide biosynthesis polyprenyl glycosylphosphotransferase
MATASKPAFDSRQFQVAAAAPKKQPKADDSTYVLPFPAARARFAFTRDEHYACYVTLDIFVLLMNTLIFSLWLPSIVGFMFAPMRLNQRELFAFCALALFLIATLLHAIGIYDLERCHGLRSQCHRITFSVCAAASLLFCFAVLLRVSLWEVSIAAITCVADICWLIGWRYALRHERERATQDRRASARRVAILGQHAPEVARKLKEHPQLGYVVSVVMLESELHPSPILLKEQLDKLLLREFIDDLFLCGLAAPVLSSLRGYVNRRTIKVHLVPDIRLMLTAKVPLRWIAGIPTMTLNDCHCDHLKLIVKRISDLVGASILLVLLSPIMLLIALAVKLTSRGPALYRGERVGEKGTTFQFLKFRTMQVDAELKWHTLRTQNEREGPFFKMKNDPRVTRIGGFLRKYSLDELPQLLNVLSGEMSLVGPRPPLPAETTLYKIEQLGRLHIKPGLTGLWQVTARRDPSFERNVELDLLYIETWSPWSDLKILAMTLPAVFSGTGQ